MIYPPISIIVAMTRNHVIGKNNALPWNVSEDLKRFKELTWGHTLVMGRNTFESIGRALPGRESIVLSSQTSWSAEGVKKASSLEEAFSLKSTKSAESIFVIGGSSVFEASLKYAQRLYITWVESSFLGDVYFPEVDWENYSSEIVGTGISRNSEIPYRFENFSLKERFNQTQTSLNLNTFNF